MKLELGPDGYERIDAGIRSVEGLAYDGALDGRDAPERFRRIVLEAKKLRQILREVLVVNPTAEAGGPDAA